MQQARVADSQPQTSFFPHGSSPNPVTESTALMQHFPTLRSDQAPNCGPSAVSVGSLRRGVISLWTIMVLATIGLVSLTTVHLGMFSAASERARLCCESAALAAGHAWLSDRLLSSNLQPFELDALDIECVNAATEISGHYIAGADAVESQCVQVAADWADPDEVLRQQAATPQALRVMYDETRQRNRTSASLFGILPCRAAATVAIENAPRGFAVPSGGSLPVFPFTLPEVVASVDGSPGASSWLDQIEKFRGPDEFSWIPDQHRFEPGPDGIPEVDLTINVGDLTGGYSSMVALDFSVPNQRQQRRWSETIQTGLLQSDLISRNMKQLDLASQMEVRPLTSMDLFEAAQEFARAKPVPGILFLSVAGDPDSGGFSGGPTVTISRPVAARCVETELIGRQQLRVRLQPGVLVTSMAVSDRSENAATNRYIYSVRPQN